MKRVVAFAFGLKEGGVNMVHHMWHDILYYMLILLWISLDWATLYHNKDNYDWSAQHMDQLHNHCSAQDHISFGQTFLARDMGDNDYRWLERYNIIKT